MDDTSTHLSDESGTAPGRASSAKPIGVLIKAFGVLETMAEMNAPAPLREIAAASGLPKGTLFRVLQTLSGLGYVAQIETSGAYFLTPKLSHLDRNAEIEDIKARLAGPMDRLHRTFNETVNLGILDPPFVRYVAVLEARRALSWGVPAGTRDLFHCTALGRAIVAHMAEDERDALVAQTTLTSRTSRTVSSREALVVMLDEVRETGIALDIEENDEGVVCLGAPVFIEGRVVASVSISVPSSRYSPALGTEIRALFRELDLDFGRPDRARPPHA